MSPSIKRKICQFKQTYKLDIEIIGVDLKTLMINLLKDIQEKMSIIKEGIKNVKRDTKNEKQNDETKKKLWNSTMQYLKLKNHCMRLKTYRTKQKKRINEP